MVFGFLKPGEMSIALLTANFQWGEEILGEVRFALKTAEKCSGLAVAVEAFQEGQRPLLGDNRQKAPRNVLFREGRDLGGPGIYDRAAVPFRFRLPDGLRPQGGGNDLMDMANRVFTGRPTPHAPVLWELRARLEISGALIHLNASRQLYVSQAVTRRDEARYCSECGEPRVPGHQFCGDCGGRHE